MFSFTGSVGDDVTILSSKHNIATDMDPRDITMSLLHRISPISHHVSPHLPDHVVLLATTRHPPKTLREWSRPSRHLAGSPTGCQGGEPDQQFHRFLLCNTTCAFLVRVAVVAACVDGSPPVGCDVGACGDGVAFCGSR